MVLTLVINEIEQTEIRRSCVKIIIQASINKKDIYIT